MDALLPIATTADWAPASVDVTIVFSTAGAGATFATAIGAAFRLTGEQIGRWSARGTLFGLLAGIVGFLLAVALLPSHDDSPEQLAAVLGVLGLRRRAAWWLLPGMLITVAGVVLVDGGAEPWVAYALAAVGTAVVVLGTGRSDLKTPSRGRLREH